MSKNVPQPLIGGMVIGHIVDRVVGKALDRVAASPSLSLEKKDVNVVRDAVVKDVVDEVGAVFENHNNREPWYRSRVLLGSYGAAMVATGNLLQMLADDVPDSLEDYWMQISVIVGIGFAIYGRLSSGKALGR